MRADPRRGRFRNLLLSTLDRFVISELRRRHAQKRSPSDELVPLEVLNDSESPQVSSAALEDSELMWTQAVIAGALLDMHAECHRSNLLYIWGVFEGRILWTILEDCRPVDYQALTERFGLRSPAQTFNALTTAKRMFRRHLRRVIAEYASDDVEVEEELRDMRRFVEPPTRIGAGF